MRDLTVLDMAQELGISSEAVNKRLQRYERKPYKYIGSAGIYRDDDLEAIREGGKRGRPVTKPQSNKPPKQTKKKITKKPSKKK